MIRFKATWSWNCTTVPAGGSLPSATACMNSGGETRSSPAAVARYSKMLSVDPTLVLPNFCLISAMRSWYGFAADAKAARRWSK